MIDEDDPMPGQSNGSAGDGQWSLEEDSCFPLGRDLSAVAYHKTLNVIIAVVDDRKVKVIDANSDTIVHQAFVYRPNDSSGRYPDRKCFWEYLPTLDKLFVAEGRSVGLRGDYQGAVMLDTILQSRCTSGVGVSSSSSSSVNINAAAGAAAGSSTANGRRGMVRIEVLFQEALDLASHLARQPQTPSSTRVMVELQKRVEAAQRAAQKNARAAKWTTVCLEITPDDLRRALRPTLEKWKRRMNDSVVSVMGTAAALLERLDWLQPMSEDDDSHDEFRMLSELARRDTFDTWPHKEYKWASPENMAQAGFYHTPSTKGTDKVVCFQCDVCLLSWEPNDDPWTEHERHADRCAFVKGDRTPNVPATIAENLGPAIRMKAPKLGRNSRTPTEKERAFVHVVSRPSAVAVNLVTGGLAAAEIDAVVSKFVAVSGKFGHIVIWNADGPLRPALSFEIDSNHPMIQAVHHPDVVGFTDLVDEGRDGPSTDSSSVLSMGNELDLASVASGSFLTSAGSRGLEVTSMCLTALQTRLDPAFGWGYLDRQQIPPFAATNAIGPYLLVGAHLPRVARRTGSGLPSPTSGDQPTGTAVEQPAGLVSEKTPYILVYCLADHYVSGLMSGGGRMKISFGETVSAPGNQDSKNGRKSPKKPDDQSKTSGTTTDSKDQSKPHPDGDNCYIDDDGIVTIDDDLAMEDDILAGVTQAEYNVLKSINAGVVKSSALPQGGKSHAEQAAEARRSMLKKRNSQDAGKNVIIPPPPLVQVLKIPWKKFFAFSGKNRSFTIADIVSFPSSDVLLVLLVREYATVKRRTPPPSVPDVAQEVSQEDSDAIREVLFDGRDDTDFHGALIAYRCSSAFGGQSRLEPIDQEPIVVKTFPSKTDVPSYIYPPPVDFVEDMLASGGDYAGERRSSSPAVFAPGATVGKRVRKEQSETVIVGTKGGMVQVLSLTDLRVLAQIQLSSKQDIVSIFYCPSTERLCCAAKTGALHYIVAKNRNPDVDSYGVIAGDNPEVVSNLMSKPLDAEFVSWVMGALKCEPLNPLFTCIAPPGWLDVSHSFQPRRVGLGTTPLIYRAGAAGSKTYPTVASEAPPAAKPPGTASTPMSFTRTYSTQGCDGKTISHQEYLFEITFPRTSSIGEIDVQFLSTRISTDDAPRIEIFLLKHNTTRNEDDAAKASTSTSEGATATTTTPRVRMAEDSAPGDPLLQSYLDEHMDDVICGPFPLAECCDLTSTGGSITLTSPYLVTAKLKSVIVLFKLRGELGAEIELPPPPNLRIRHPTELMGSLFKNADNEKLVKIIKGKLKSSKYKYPGMGNTYVDYHASLTGGGLGGATFGAAGPRARGVIQPPPNPAWLGQVSITIRKCYISKRIEERCIRAALLHCSLFHERLLNHLGNRVPNGDPKVSTEDETVRTQLMDLLLWIATTLLTSPPCVPDGPHGEGSSNNRWASSTTAPAYDPARKRALEFVVGLVDMTNRLIDMCLLNASRTVAHKTARLFAMALTYAKTIGDDDLFNSIGNRLCDALIKRLKHTLVSPSAGAVHWFFVLFNHVKACKPTLALQACISTLEVIATQMAERDDYVSAVFRSRYGLYGMPLEAELFEFPSNRLASLGVAPLQPPAQVSLFPPGTTIGLQSKKDAATQHKTGSIIPPTAVIDPYTGSVIHPHGALGVLPDGQPAVDRAAALAAAGNGTDWDLRDIVELWTAERQNQRCKDVDPAEAFLRQLNGNRLLQPMVQKTPIEVMAGLFEAEPLSFSLKESSEGTKLERTTGNSFGLVMGSKLDLQQTVFNNPGTFVPNELNPADAMWIWERLLRDGYDYNFKILIERLHSGARRYVTLDFGQPVVLTDVCIPPCNDLASVIIDAWVDGEDVDGKTIVTSKDISTNMVVLSDLHPQIVCQYLKLTVVGKYGLNAQTKSRVPLGLFFGHALSVGEGDPRYLSTGRLHYERVSLTTKLGLVRAATSEVSCHYEMTRSRLKNLVVTNAYPGTSNRDHLKHFLERVEMTADRANGMPVPATEEDRKIYAMFQECLQLQQRLNILKGIESRIETHLGLNHSPYTRATMQLLSSPNQLNCPSKDQLRVVSHHVLAAACSAAYNELLFDTTYPPEGKTTSEDVKRKQCWLLFESFCVKGWSGRHQVGICGLILSVFGRENWFGEFIGDAIVKLFTSGNMEPFPQERVFTLLAYMGQQAMIKYENADIVRCTLFRIIELLSPLQSSANSSRLSSFDIDPFENRSPPPRVDSNVVGWMFLYLNACLSTVTSITDSGLWEGSGKEDAFLQSSKANLDAYLNGGAVHLRRKNRVKGRSSTIARPPTRWSFLFGDCVSNLDGAAPLNPNANARGLRRRHAIRGFAHQHHPTLGSWYKTAEKKLGGKVKFYKEALKAAQGGGTVNEPALIKSVGEDMKFLVKFLEKQVKGEFESTGASNATDAVTMMRALTRANDLLSEKLSESKAPAAVATETKPEFALPRDDCVAAARAIVSYIMTMDFSGGVDLFLLACQNLAYVVRAAGGPTLKLREIMTQKQLDELLGLSFAGSAGGGSFGTSLPSSLGMSSPPVGSNWSSWISYTIFTVLVDLLESEIDERENERSAAMSARASVSRSSSRSRKSKSRPQRRSAPPRLSNVHVGMMGAEPPSPYPGPNVVGLHEDDGSIVEDLDDDYDDEMDEDDEDVDMLDADEHYSDDSFYPPLQEDSWEEAYGEMYSDPSYDVGDLVFDAAATPTNDGPGGSSDMPSTSAGMDDQMEGQAAGNEPSSGTIAGGAGTSEESTDTVRKDAATGTAGEVPGEAVIPPKRFRSSGLVSGVLIPGVSAAIDYQSHPDAGPLRLPEMQLANMMGCGLGAQVVYGSPFVSDEFTRRMEQRERMDEQDDDATPVPPELPPDPESPVPPPVSAPSGLPCSLDMLGQTFNKYFAMIEHGGVSVEKLLLTWLSLNNSLSREMTETDRARKVGDTLPVIQVVYPVVPLPPASVGCLLAYLRRKTNVPSRVWSLAFKVLACVANQTLPGADGMDFPLESSSIASWRTILNDRNFSGFLFKFLSSVPADVASGEVASAAPVGACTGDAFDRFLMWMSMRAETKMSDMKSSVKWKVTMLKLLLDLLTGPIQTYQGPVDAQHMFIDHVAGLEFKNVSVGLMKSVVEAIISYASDVTEKDIEIERRPGASAAPTTQGIRVPGVRPADGEQDTYYVPIPSFGSVLERNPDLGAAGVYRMTFDQDLYSLLVKLVKFGGKLAHTPVPKSQLAPSPRQQEMPPPPPPAGYENQDLEQLTDASKIEQLDHSAIPGTDPQTDESKAAAVSGDRQHPQRPRDATSVLDSTITVAAVARAINSMQHVMQSLITAVARCPDSCHDQPTGPAPPAATNNDTKPYGAGYGKSPYVYDDCYMPERANRTATTAASSSDGGSPRPSPLGVVGEALRDLLIVLLKEAEDRAHSVMPILEYVKGRSALGMKTVPPLTNHLLNAFGQVLERGDNVKEFQRLGGFEVLAANIVMETRWEVNSQPSQAAALMQQWLNKPRNPLGQSPYPLLNKEECLYDPRKSRGLFNVAPLASEVRCARSESSCPSVLVRPAAPHRRARSAAWSYNFREEDSSVDVFLTLPFPVLVWEIIATPQASTRLSCPSAMSVELQQDDGGIWVPVGSVLPTPCLSSIRVDLNPPRIATALCIRFYKPHDSSTVGLAHIKVMASTLFGTADAEAKRGSKHGISNGGAHLALIVNTLQAIDYEESHAALVIEHDPTLLADTIGLKSHIMGQMVRAPGLVPALASMLLQVASNPPPRPSALPYILDSKGAIDVMANFEPAMPSIENLLVRICRSGTSDVAEKLVSWLLAAPLPQYASKPRKNRADLAVVELIYRLSRKAADDLNLDQSRRLVLRVMVKWLGFTARAMVDRMKAGGYSGEEGLTGTPSYLHCLACILWEYVTKNDEMVDGLLDDSLVSVLADWSRDLAGNSKTKIAVDTLLCSICAVKPSLLRSLLLKLRIIKCVKTHDPNVSVSDDSKDRAAEIESAITDESKIGVANREHEQVVPMIETYVLKSEESFDVSPKTLKMLGVVCQSRGAAEFLRDVGFLDKVLSSVLVFCEKSFIRGLVEPEVLGTLKYRGRDDIKRMTNNMTVSGELVSAVVDMFVDLTYCGSGGAVAEWLCAGGGSQFWVPWLLFLSRLSSSGGEGALRNAAAGIRSENRQWLDVMESNTLKLLRRCAWCAPKNHRAIAEALVLILMNSPKISQEATIFAHGAPGFLRRLVLFVMLEKEKIPVHIQIKSASVDPDSLDYNVFSVPVGTNRPQFPKPNLGGPTKRLGHPSVGTGSTNLIFTARMDETFADISQRIPGVALPKKAAPAPQKPAPAKRKKLPTMFATEPFEEDYSSFVISYSDLQNPYLASLGGLYDAAYPAVDPAMDVASGSAGAGEAAAAKMQQKKEQEDVPAARTTSVIVRHEAMRQNLCDKMTAGQLLALLSDFDMADPSNMLPLSVCVTKRGNETDTNANETAVMAGFVNGPNALPDSVLLEVRQTPTLLETFAKMGGLVVLAPLVPLMNTLLTKGTVSSVLQAPIGTADRAAPFGLAANSQQAKWTKPDDAFEDVDEEVLDFLFPEDLPPFAVQGEVQSIPVYQAGYGLSNPLSSVLSSAPVATATAAAVAAATGHGMGAARGRATASGASFPSPWDPLAFPPHVLPMMALFLRLHGYSDYFLKCQPKARKLLRLAFGVTDDGDGNCIIPTLEASAKASPTDSTADNVGLAFYPFQALADYLDGLELTTDDGLVARRMLIDAGALHLILGCIAVLSHSRDNQLEMPGRHSELTLSFLRASISSASDNSSNATAPQAAPPMMSSMTLMSSSAASAAVAAAAGIPPGTIAIPAHMAYPGGYPIQVGGATGVALGSGAGPKMYAQPKTTPGYVIGMPTTSGGATGIPIAIPIPSIVDPNTGVLISSAGYALPMTTTTTAAVGSAAGGGAGAPGVAVSTTSAMMDNSHPPPNTYVLTPGGPQISTTYVAAPMGPVPMGNTVPAAATANTKKQDGQFWAKGTGFGTGSTAAAWDVERAFKRLEARERHLAALIRCLSAFIRPTCGASMDFKEPGAEKKKEDDKDKKKEQQDGSGDSQKDEVQKMDVDVPVAPDSFVNSITDIMKKSCIRDAIRSYLRNDSVLDMARHVPLYSSILELLRAVAATPNLVFLLLLDAHEPEAGEVVDGQQLYITDIHESDQGGDVKMDDSMVADANRSDPLAITNLLNNMNKCVETYARTLRGSQFDGTRKKKDASKPPQQTDEAVVAAAGSAGGGGDASHDEPAEGSSSATNAAQWDEKMAAIDSDDQGLALLIPQIRATAQKVKGVTDRFVKRRSESSADGVDGARAGSKSEDPSKKLPRRLTAELYTNTMRPLQFVEHEIIKEDDPDAVNVADRIRFTVPFHFERDVRASMSGGGAAGQVHSGRLKRLAQEMVSLSSALPLSLSSSVFVRCDMDRLDVMKVLITGPEDTPYANGIFEFDVFFPLDYPNAPMKVHLQTTGNHSVRFNPNLYNDGKVCLSVLNTWHGRPEEKWNPHTSSLLQVLVSIQSLILVPDPYFNEPGYEKSRNTASGMQASREYDANIRQATVRWGMLEQLRNPTACFKDVILRHFWLKRGELVRQLDEWVTEMENPALIRQGRQGIMQQCCKELKRNYGFLKDELTKMQPPAGLEDVIVDPPPVPAVEQPHPAPRTSSASCAPPGSKKQKVAIPTAHGSALGPNLKMSKSKAEMSKDKKKFHAMKAHYKKWKAKKTQSQEEVGGEEKDKEKKDEEKGEEDLDVVDYNSDESSGDDGPDNGGGGGGFQPVQAIAI